MATSEHGQGGWIGVDLDGVLAWWDPRHFPEIGPPIEGMIPRVLGWLAEGKDVRIFTARVAIVSGLRNGDGQEADIEFALLQRAKIENWCEEHLGRVLPVTAVKDFCCIELWDDRCVQMITNEGISLREWMHAELDALQEHIGRAAKVI